MGLYDFTIYDLIKRNSRLYSNREAWIFEQNRITFRKFQEQVDCLACGLSSIGLNKGDRIAVLSQNCFEFVLLYGAAAKLGAIMLPVNWRLTPPEVEYILSDAQPRFFFIGAEFESIAKDLSDKLSFIEKSFTFGLENANFVSFDHLMKENKNLPETEVFQNDPYLIIHTAAIDGKPRGATLSQGNIIAANVQQVTTIGLNETDSYLNLLPIFHIAGISLFFTTMHAAGKNVLIPKFDPEEALKQIEKEKITIIGEFPPMLGMLLEKMDGKNYDISSLKHVEGIDHPANIEKLRQKADAEFWIGFGQSETTGIATICSYSEKPGSAGKDGILVHTKLVDDYDRTVGIGEPGEICIRGPLVFLGYWNMEEHNRYVFRDGWHHTGDIGKLDENGYLWYLKRKAEKELIKPGGENVYPAEVEKVILENPEIAEVSVIGVMDPEWGEAIKAVCVIKPGSSLTPNSLIEFVAARIARYKKPKYIQFVSELPRNEDGSPDRDRIKADYGKIK